MTEGIKQRPSARVGRTTKVEPRRATESHEEPRSVLVPIERQERVKQVRYHARLMGRDWLRENDPEWAEPQWDPLDSRSAEHVDTFEAYRDEDDPPELDDDFRELTDIFPTD